jgi:hypothetical protein
MAATSAMMIAAVWGDWTSAPKDAERDADTDQHDEVDRSRECRLGAGVAPVELACESSRRPLGQPCGNEHSDVERSYCLCT